eukprot:TRINITY_DN5761_c0_g1_i1.p1 TRINITY_DN5761_c0_g1~~TRINITY_DN5761_c0_g1_i1.p1  ORF type:complete len:107 (-),score=19.07 TRINITY_DN5761_c0_g1_i1:237-557(-)
MSEFKLERLKMKDLIQVLMMTLNRTWKDQKFFKIGVEEYFITRIEENWIIAKNGNDDAVVLHGKFTYAQPLIICFQKKFSECRGTCLKYIRNLLTHLDKYSQVPKV